MKRFVVYPGWVTSKNDWDRHFISAPVLMRLMGLRPPECVVIDQRRPETCVGHPPEFVNSLMPIRPQWGVDYRPVTESERMTWPRPI